MKQKQRPPLYILLTLYVVSKMKRFGSSARSFSYFKYKEIIMNLPGAAVTESYAPFCCTDVSAELPDMFRVQNIIEMCFWLHCLNRGHHAVRSPQRATAGWLGASRLLHRHVSHKVFHLLQLRFQGVSSKRCRLN